MLVLSRRQGERIIIDGGIKIDVVEIRRNRVRLGITAPGGIGVIREEIILREAEAAEITEILPQTLAALE